MYVGKVETKQTKNMKNNISPSVLRWRAERRKQKIKVVGETIAIILYPIAITLIVVAGMWITLP